MSAEEILQQINKNNVQITELVKANQKLQSELQSADWDRITVTTAAKLYDVSASEIYKKISTGEIKSSKFCNRIYVSRNDIQSYFI